MLETLSRTDKETIALIGAEKARRHLLDFCIFTLPGYEIAPHLELLAEKLEAVERGDIKRLMIFMPPRHGKSEMASIRFPAWVLGRDPNKRLIHTSYDATLSNNFSRQTRNLLEERLTRLVFSITTAQDSRARGKWDVAGYKGGMISAGVGGAVTGHGADILIIDDPVKNKEEAESEVYREKTYAWYQNVARTRLEPDGAIILIMTRWHQKDLAGKILAEHNGWEVIDLPAIAEEGDTLKRAVGVALWPDRYSREELDLIRLDVGSRTWYALYQQKPRDPEGAIIKREWIRWYNALPPGCTRGAGIDTATSMKTTADNMALVDVARDKEGFINVDDCFCDKLSVRAFSEMVCMRHSDRRYNRIKIEENAAGDAVRQRILEESRNRKGDVPITGFKTSTDKIVRVMNFQALIENGTIRFNKNNAKVRALVEHLCNFDGKGSAIDDDVDALGFAIESIRQSAANIRFI